MTRRAIATQVLGLALAGVLAMPATAAAEDDDFKKGFDAYGDKKWADVVRFMQAAIKDDGREAPRKVRSGLFRQRDTEYVPHFYLGDAYFHQNNCARALGEWEISEQYGVVTNRAEFIKIIRDGYGACQAQGLLLAADLKTTNGATRQTYDNALAVAQRVSDLMRRAPAGARSSADGPFEQARAELTTAQERLGRGADTRARSDFEASRAAAERAIAVLKPVEANLLAAISTVTVVQQRSNEIEQLITGAEATDRSIDTINVALPAEFTASRSSARNQLSQARERLGAGQASQNLATLQEGLDYARSASTLLADLLGRAKKLGRASFERQLQDAVKGGDEIFSFIDASLLSVERLALERPALVRPELAQQQKDLRKEVEALRRRFDRARIAEDLAALERTRLALVEQHAAVEALMKSFGPVTLQDRGVHAALEEGARLFLDGHYQNALAALDPLNGVNNLPLQLHVHLFRAAAHYALYVHSGATDDAQKAAATSEIERCKQLNSTFTPDRRAFSPAFITFYQKAGVTAAVPAATQSQ
jgi:hypothetical protein